MKTYTIACYTTEGTGWIYNYGIITKFYNKTELNNRYFSGWHANTLTECWNKMRNPQAGEREVGAIEDKYFKCPTAPDLIYEISEEELLGLIKIEQLTGRL